MPLGYVVTTAAAVCHFGKNSRTCMSCFIGQLLSASTGQLCWPSFISCL